MKNFPYIFETGYTAQLESELDDVEDGTEKWTDLLKGFYGHFEEELKVAETEMEDIKAMEEKTDEICEKCGAPLVLKWGKFGSFYSCSNFSKAKPMTVAQGPLKKDPKAAVKKVTAKLHFPMFVKAMNDDVTESSTKVEDKAALLEALQAAASRRRSRRHQAGRRGRQLRLHQGELRRQARPRCARAPTPRPKRSSATTAAA